MEYLVKGSKCISIGKSVPHKFGDDLPSSLLSLVKVCVEVITEDMIA